MPKQRNYRIMVEDERDDMLVEFLEAQERDLASHDLNAERYEAMLTTLPAGKWRERIEHLLAETRDRLIEVESIIEATEPQLPAAHRMEASKLRIKAKREARGA